MNPAARPLPIVISWAGPHDPNTELVLTTYRNLLRAEVCALFLVHEKIEDSDARTGGRIKRVELEAHVGYCRADGSAIPLDELRLAMSYRVTPPSEQRMGTRGDGEPSYDGVTGFVASAGIEVVAEAAEIRKIPSHAGRPNALGIWDDTHPFRNVVAVPIKRGALTTGVLKVENKIGGTFDATDVALLRHLASLFALTIPADQDRSPAELVSLHDRSDMASVIRRMYDQVDYARTDSTFAPLKDRQVRNAIVVGMGGSALPVDVLNAAFEEALDRPVAVARHYRLPRSVDADTLIILSSFSGNTEETLTVARALPANATTVVIRPAGGRLADLGAARGYPVILVPRLREVAGFQPRCATGYMVTYLARALMDTGLMNDVTGQLEDLSAFLRTLDLSDQGLAFARRLGQRTPVFYTDDCYERSVGRIAKIKFNENAKRPAFFSALPEANHNEMIGFSGRSGSYTFAFFGEPATDEIGRAVNQRFEVMKELFRRERYTHVAFDQWTMPGRTRLQRIFGTLTYVDWITYWAALLDGNDPTPVRLVEDFKRQLEASRGNDAPAAVSRYTTG